MIRIKFVRTLENSQRLIATKEAQTQELVGLKILGSFAATLLTFAP